MINILIGILLWQTMTFVFYFITDEDEKTFYFSVIVPFLVFAISFELCKMLGLTERYVYHTIMVIGSGDKFMISGRNMKKHKKELDELKEKKVIIYNRFTYIPYRNKARYIKKGFKLIKNPNQIKLD